MEEQLHILDNHDLENSNKLTLAALEAGKIIYLPSYSFPLQSSEESKLFSDKILDGKHKNLSFDYRTQCLGGLLQKGDEHQLAMTLKDFMKRFAEFSKQLVDTILPQYQNFLQWGRTSYRPAEIKGRPSSKRKDDTRLHIDSFPSTPVNGLRILRLFCNVNPDGKPRVWHLGEPFSKVLERFAPHIPTYNRTLAKFLYLIKATKTLRSPYDHYQLSLHNRMKLSDEYQQGVSKQRVDFPAQSTWIVFTDQVSHAALAGQFLLEQTFYLPITAMANPTLSPLKLWEKKRAEQLIKERARNNFRN
jgi:3-deoxy-D-manno-oct-2-ulosonic acid (Kdo) hydroxylase